MRLYRHSAWSAIKSKTARIVKLVGVLGVGSVLWLSPPLARGEDPPSSPPPTEELPPVQVQMLSPDMKGSQQQEAPPLPPQPPQPAQAPPPPAAPPPAPTPSGSVSPSPKPEELPDIQARYYPVSVVRHSSSDKVYLLADTSDAKPRPGRILLLRKPDSPTDPAYQIMAFRILRTYPEKKQFAAKVVKKYGDNRVLSDNSTYSAIEKLSDYTPPTPTPQDKADLKELESKPAPAPSTAPGDGALSVAARARGLSCTGTSARGFSIAGCLRTGRGRTAR
ncbi:MAG: hypothetical protein ACXWP5_07740 [Bdellovibrionota bacterium]